MNRLYIWFTILFTIFILSLISAINLAHADTDFNKLRNSVVMVDIPGGLGTGVVYAKNKVLTAAHVVENRDTVMVGGMGSDIEVAGTVLKRNKDQDWAIISVPTGTIVPMPFDCRMPIYAEPLATIGYPLGLEKLISKGVVASDKLEDNTIFMDIRINHGNSGGPVIDSNGKFIGLAIAMVVPKDGPGISIMTPLSLFCKELN